jgi:hypothetical protein
MSMVLTIEAQIGFVPAQTERGWRLENAEAGAL